MNREHDTPYHGPHPWVRLKEIARPESRDLWIAVVYSVAIGLLSLVLPIATQAIVNTVAFGVLLQPLVILALLVLAALFFNTLLNAFRFWVVEIIQRRIFVRLASESTSRLLDVRSEAFDRYHGPELVNRFLEVATVQKVAASLLVDGLGVVMQSVIGMILLAVYHPWLLAFDVLLLVSILVVLFPLGTGAVPTAVKESKAKYELVAWLQEIARNQMIFKTGRGSVVAQMRTDDLMCSYLGYRKKHFRILLRQIVGTYLLQAFASATLLGVGGWLVVSRQLTLGQLVAAELVVALVVSGITKFGKHLESFYDLLAATDKLGYLSDLPAERSGGEKPALQPGGGALRLNEISVGYDPNRPLIANADWEIPAGAKVGLVGPLGSGKSLLLDVLYGLREPLGGHIELGRHDFRDLSLRHLRDSVALVREPEIYESTLLENLRVGDPNLDSASARDILDRVGLLDTVMALPDGLHTHLATGGQPLSPGQAMLLELARALARNPKVLIIDESLDRLDDLTVREKVLDTLFDAGAPWTLVVCSENERVLARCQRVFVLEDRSIQEMAGQAP